MADNNILSGSLQENIITALVFANDSNSRIVSRLVDLNWFEDPYREVAEKVIRYWHEHDTPPGEAHIDDVLDFVLNDPTHRRYNIYTRLMERIVRLNHTLNTKYVYNRLFEFARRQNLKRAIFEAGTILSQSNDPDDYDKVEAILSGVSKFQNDQYDLGFSLFDTEKSLSFLDKADNSQRLSLNIPELDDNGINPSRGELFMILAPRGRGKSMFLHHIGRCALGDRVQWNTLHITLENSAEATAQRYFQGRFAVATRDGSENITELSKDHDGIVAGFARNKNPAQHFANPDAERFYLQQQIALWEKYNRSMTSLRIKEFPTGDLSFEKLESFLDHLETVNRFVPSLILLDYPDLMYYDRRHDPRLGLGRLYQQLRGLAVKRDLAMVVVSQSTREGETARLVDSYHAAEDISKIATADYVVTYTQTKQEYELGLARLYVAKARNERQWFTVLVSQNYAAAQFHIDSALMKQPKPYFELVEKTNEEKTNEDKKEEDDG